MKKRCVSCSAQFSITPEHRAMMDRLSPVIGGTTLTLPDPTHCPSCRQQRRIAFRNDSHYYKNTCSSCKKSVISIYSPDKGFPVLCHECFWSDQWDALEYGRDFDFSKTFAEQHLELRKTVPRLCIFNTQSENSDYTVHSSRNKNCYMGSSLVDNEHVYFSDFMFHSKDSIDCFSSERMELCYSCVLSEDCYNSDWLTLCFNTTDSMYSYDCKGCTKVLGCTGRRSTTSEILNRPVSEKEFQETRAKLLTDSHVREEFLRKVAELRKEIPVPNVWSIASEASTGNYLFHCKGVRFGYNTKYLEDCEYAYEVHRCTDSCDIMRIGNGELLYDCTNIVDLSRGVFCSLTYQCDNLLYCDNCNGTSESFGCFSTKKVKHCILNKQYTQEEYEALVPKIVEHMRNDGAAMNQNGASGSWGEFFPVSLSSFGYNETKAYGVYPLTKEEVLKRGWKWSDYEQSVPEDLKGIEATRLPEDIQDVPDDILNYVIMSEDTRKPFRLIPQELEFYRKKGLPVPRRHPHERLLALATPFNPKALYKRTCDKCAVVIETTYAPEEKAKVYCEKCYLDAVY